jgi:galactokinase
MAAEARRQPACFGARLTGAGFGGCAVALVESDGVEEFREQVEAGYARETRREARTFASRPARGAHLLE